MGKKYTLYSNDNGQDGEKPKCAFFLSKEGCRNGDECKFSHSMTTVVPERKNNTCSNADMASTVSSESSDDDDQQEEVERVVPVMTTTFGDMARSGNIPQATNISSPPQNLQQQDYGEGSGGGGGGGESNSNNKKRKRRRGNDDMIFAKPKHAKFTEEPTKKTEVAGNMVNTDKKKKKKAKKEPAVTAADNSQNNQRNYPTAMSYGPVSPPPGGMSMTQTQTRPITSPPVTPSFRSLNLPVTSFSVLPSDSQNNNNHHQKTPPPPVVKKEPKYVVPVSSARGLVWKELVAKCHGHERFIKEYDMKKWKEDSSSSNNNNKKNSNDHKNGWIQAKPYGDWCASFPQAVAIDCEMCETQNPETGEKDPSALCRVSIVNAENPTDVLLDSLVKPDWPVSDHRTWVNGIGPSDLEHVAFGLGHAQAFLQALCSSETVIVGHAVHNDLKALKMQHTCVVDSVYLFQAKDAPPTASVSLRDIVKTLFQQEMPTVHDSVHDAKMALKCVEIYRERDGKVDSITRSPSAKAKFAKQLFCHRIPKMCQPTHLSSMFLEHTMVDPDQVDDIEFSGTFGKTLVHFRTAAHANLAFDTLEGSVMTDKSGRSQKKVFLRNGDYMNVRKMIFEKKNEREGYAQQEQQQQQQQ